MTPSWIPLLALAGCHLGVADDVREVPRDSARPADTDPGSDDTGAAADPFETDDDGDGYSENGGDCDDEDPARHPDQRDGCNGIDDDCDGERDEDARDDDPYEPNDETWTDLGSLDEAGSFSVTAFLHSDEDDDRFAFAVDDPWYEEFGFEVRLSGIPSDGVYRIALGRVAEDGALTDSEAAYGGDTLALTRAGTAGVDDAGTYGVIVDAVGGADCARAYLLTVTDR